ncbi:alpha/beta hydrolase [Hymenobacter chitinivorans]|uniref:Acetyl esterase n=1 Tax=Hymenobacter chitinivorans DSM 11115 TaxID=1121954 RepID=A0A2M9BR89_9BACT|nr:alpha/beta hydrolase [Hymenobacter chitinivorans]PJJ60453.1 acetyl esterase [Hymenobacter chitinivorans DSM 11115]
MQKTTAALLLSPLLAAGLLTWAWRSKPYSIQADGCATITFAGRIRLAVLRQLLQRFGGQTARRLGLPKLPVRLVEQYVVPTSQGPTPVTLYWPDLPPQGPLPVYVNLHGGGFVLGHPLQDDRLCRYIAQQARCLVVNVDYALAPEYPFPAPVQQSYEVVRWVHEQAATLGYDAGRLAIGGRSAGGSLAAAVALLARERQEFTLALQVLDYPSLNLADRTDHKHVRPRRKQVLSVELASFFKHLYVPCPADRLNPLASPLLAPDLRGLAPALIITAEYDLLRDDGLAYARRLQEQGVAVMHEEFAGVDHGFTLLGPREPARRAWELMATSLRKALHSFS